MNNFTFNGRNSRDFGILVESFPNEAGGDKIITSVQIPGRTGALTIDTGAYSNITKSYPVAFRHYMSTERMREIRQWLALSSGYCRLEDTYDPDVFMLARAINLPDFENIKNRFGKGTIEFDCDPRRFLKEGERAITGNIQNDWMPCKPIIILEGTGTATIGNYTITVNTDPSVAIYVDCELMEIHNGSTNLASYVTMSDFPVLENGTTAVSYTNTSLSIIPNFWMP